MKLSTLLVLPALFWTSNSQALNQLFNLVPGGGPGSCDAAQLPAVNSWLADTRTLVDFAVNAMNNFDINDPGADPSLQRNLVAWFKVRRSPGAASITTITSK
jgi:hypothetical protein